MSLYNLFLSVGSALTQITSWILIGIIRIYQQFFSPDTGIFMKNKVPTCKFYPSCSSYALEAIEKKGIFIGLYLMLTRIARCNPWHEGGYDPL